MEVYNIIIILKRPNKHAITTSTSLSNLNSSFLLKYSTMSEVPGNIDLQNNKLMSSIYMCIYYLIKSLVTVLYVFESLINPEKEIKSVAIFILKKIALSCLN